MGGHRRIPRSVLAAIVLLLTPTIAMALAPIWWLLSVGAHVAALSFVFLSGSITPAQPTDTTSISVILDGSQPSTPTGWTDPDTPPSTSTSLAGQYPIVPPTYPDIIADMGYQSGSERTYCYGAGCDTGIGSAVFSTRYISELTSVALDCTTTSSVAPVGYGTAPSWCGAPGDGNIWAVWSRTESFSICPDGYSASGAECVLTDSTQVMWPSDGECTTRKLPGVSAIEAFIRDPDCTPGQMTSITITEADKNVTITPSVTSTSIYQDDAGSVGSYYEDMVVDDTGTVTSYSGVTPSGTGGAGTGGTGGTGGCDPTVSNCTGTGPIGTDLYTPTTKTYDSVLSEFRARVSAAPAISAATTFFTLTLPNLPCPVWTLPATGLTPSIAIDMQCSSAMESVWPIVSAVMIATAGFIAFRWAFL